MNQKNDKQYFNLVGVRLSTNMALKSRFSDVAIPENKSWPEFVYEKFDEYGDKTAIVSTKMSNPE